MRNGKYGDGVNMADVSTSYIFSPFRQANSWLSCAIVRLGPGKASVD